jgi:hypothetical protein
MRLLFLFTLILQFATVASAGTEPLTCGAPAATLYHADLNDALKMQLMAEFPIAKDPQLPEKLGVSGSKAVIAQVNAQGLTEYIPVLLSTRGKSRAKYCAFPPLRIRFLSSRTQGQIRRQVGAAESLQTYFDVFAHFPLSTEDLLDGDGPGVFKKLGDDVKLVTHCGVPHGWKSLGAPSEELQTDKLRGEYYMYRLLAEMKIPVEATRLAEITYRDQNGQPVFATAKPAFFREPTKSLAKRCGVLGKPPVPKEQLRDNAASKLDLQFINKLILNYDFDAGNGVGQWARNANLLYGPAGEIFFGPYDFDLSSVVFDTEMKTREDFQRKLQKFVAFVKASDPALTAPRLARLRAALPKFAELVAQMELSPVRRHNFETWLDVVTETLAGL